MMTFTLASLTCRSSPRVLETVPTTRAYLVCVATPSIPIYMCPVIPLAITDSALPSVVSA
jgi:hypothetical protein